MKYSLFLLLMMSCAHSPKNNLHMKYVSAFEKGIYQLKVTTDESLREEIFYVTELYSFNNCQKINNRFPRVHKQVVVPGNAPTVNMVERAYTCDLDKSLEVGMIDILKYACKKSSHHDVVELCKTARPYYLTHQ